MANIYDYLMWRGDISLDERPFNDVDNVILSCLSYFDFTGVVPSEEDGGSISLARACRKLISKGGGDAKQFVRAFSLLDTRFLTLLAESARFESAELCAYCDVYDEKRSLQFAAIQVNLPTSLTYVSYRGTDSTLVGWREDFMLSFQVTEAQRMATEYLNRAIPRATELGNSVMVGGHSKGGNLAEYAAVNCLEELRGHILRVFSNDGPGMAPELTLADPGEVLGNRLRRIVPTYSVVGMLFAKPHDHRSVVKSKAVGIAQHDPCTWQVTRSGILDGLRLDRECVVLNDAIAKWAKSVPLDKRAHFINEVFDALGAGGAKSLDHIADSAEDFQKVLSAFRATDEQTRELASALIDSTVNNSVAAVREATKKTLNQWRKELFGSAGGTARKLFGDNNALKNIERKH